MQQIVRTILDQARATVASRASAGDMACGLVAALRRLRAIFDAGSGGSGGFDFDDAVRSLVLKHAAKESARLRTAPKPVVLPAPGPQAAFAGVVLEDAVMSCLGLAGMVPAAAIAALCAEGLVEALIDTLGGAPDASTLVDQIRPGHEESTVLAALPSLSLQ